METGNRYNFKDCGRIMDGIYLGTFENEKLKESYHIFISDEDSSHFPYLVPNSSIITDEKEIKENELIQILRYPNDQDFFTKVLDWHYNNLK